MFKYFGIEYLLSCLCCLNTFKTELRICLQGAKDVPLTEHHFLNLCNILYKLDQFFSKRT